MEKTKSCKGKHFQWYVCVGPNPLTELYASYILHSKLCFLNFGLHIPRPRQVEPPAKCYAEVVIINRISANSYDIVQAYSYKVLELLLLLSLAITSTLMQIVPIISSLCLNHKVYIKSIRFFINLYKLVSSLAVATWYQSTPHILPFCPCWFVLNISV